MSFLEEPGDLAETPLAAILIEALNLRVSGVLEVAHGGGTSRLWFRDGRPVGAQVFSGFKPLGMMLLQEGLIDVDTLSKSLALMAETRRPQGEILIGMGAVAAEDVARTLAEQQAGYFGLIATLDQGPFVFDASTPVPDWTRTSPLSPVRTIVDALERPQANALVVAALQPVAAAGVRLSSGYPEIAGAFRWTGAERELVARLEAPVSLDAFFAPSRVAPERARAILAGLLLLGLAAPGAGGDAAAGEESTVGIAIGPEELAPSPPPRGEPPLASQRRGDPAEARARRQRLLQHAMRNMGIGPFATRPDEGRGAAAAPQPRAATPVPSVRPPSGATSEEAQLRDALLAIAPRAKDEDLFARLALTRTAGREEVRKAFLALVRQFHPDRFASPALADLQRTVRDFFSGVNEAYEVLSDDRKRGEYLSRRKGDPRAHPARTDAEKGEACLRTRDFQRARGFLEAAVRGDPRPEYRAALAWAFVADPSCRDRARAKALVVEAMRDPSCDRAFFVAGVIAREEGDAAAAERHFRAAVAANPRNADALRELRVIEARRAESRRG